MYWFDTIRIPLRLRVLKRSGREALKSYKTEADKNIADGKIAGTFQTVHVTKQKQFSRRAAEVAEKEKNCEPPQANGVLKIHNKF